MKKNNVVKVNELVKLINACGFNGRSKKSAAKFIAEHEGYETARANNKDDGYTDIGIIITTPNKNRIVIWWDSDLKSWDAYYINNYTPEEYDLSQLRREAKKSFEDKHFSKHYWGGSVNKAVQKYRINKSKEIYEQLKAAKDEVRRLEKLYYSTPSF